MVIYVPSFAAIVPLAIVDPAEFLSVIVSEALKVPVTPLSFNLILPCPANPVPPGFSPTILSCAK